MKSTLKTAMLCSVAMTSVLLVSPSTWANDDRLTPPEPAVECQVDGDCGEGMVCELVPLIGCSLEYLEEHGHCESDEAPPQGTCVPGQEEPPVEAECQEDADCARGMVCELIPLIGCSLEYLEEHGHCESEDAEPQGVCVPVSVEPAPEAECQEDADCARGMVCELIPLIGCSLEYLEENGHCESEDAEPQGVCVPVSVEPAPEAECQEDADCGEGMVCELIPLIGCSLEYLEENGHCESEDTEPQRVCVVENDESSDPEITDEATETVGGQHSVDATINCQVAPAGSAAQAGWLPLSLLVSFLFGRGWRRR